MKILAVIGSPQQRGNTHRLVRRIERRVTQQADIEFEYLFLADGDLGMCRGCAVCLTRGEEHCPLDDDRAEIERRLLEADGVILACPVYAMDMPGLMKNFMDRFAYSMHRPRFFAQKTLLVSTTGAIGTKETLQRLSAMAYTGFDIVGRVGVATPSGPATKGEHRAITRAAERGAAMLLKALRTPGRLPATLGGLITFRIQQLVFAANADDWQADYAYYESRGWFDPRRQFYVDAPINPLKAFLARIAQWLMRGRIERDVQERRSPEAKRWWDEDAEYPEE